MNIIRDIVFQIRSRRDDLSVTERKVADAILDNIIWSASATVDQLAAKAGVSIEMCIRDRSISARESPARLPEPQSISHENLQSFLKSWTTPCYISE